MIQDPARLDRIRELSLEWLATDPTRRHLIEAAEQGKDIILRSGTALAVVHGPKEYLWTCVDSAIALTYLELQAATMGLGSCWAGLITIASEHIPKLREVLAIPEAHRMGGGVMLGIPRQKHYLVPPRNPARVVWL